MDFLGAALEKLKEVVGMMDEDGEPSALDEVLRRVLQHGTADARGGNTSNRLGLTRAMNPEYMVEESAARRWKMPRTSAGTGMSLPGRNCTT